MCEVVREVAGSGLVGCSGDGFRQRLGWWRPAVPRPGVLLLKRGDDTPLLRRAVPSRNAPTVKATSSLAAPQGRNRGS